MYQCVVCDQPIDPNASGTFHQVTCWVEVGKRTNIKNIDKLYRYAHRICVEAPSVGQSERLFD
jgi:predicted GNAT superfamily acetyltransferase